MCFFKYIIYYTQNDDVKKMYLARYLYHKYRSIFLKKFNIYICAGAKIIGNITISDNVRVGANAVVYENVPYNSTVVLNGSRVIIKNKKQDNRFIDIANL